MPIYEYVCEKCGSHLEVMQKVSDAPLKRCQKCRGKLEKIFSRTSFQLKGSGWYVTDYSKPKSPADAKPDKGAEKKSESASSSKSSAGASTPSE
jgi:putative FmdB family regulatory protein